MMARFTSHERREIERLQHVIDLVTHDGCQANALAAYFGEQRSGPCGHCMWCTAHTPQRFPPPVAPPPMASLVSREVLQTLRASQPVALREPRQVARLLCGITSPALTTARLSRHPLFGVLATHRFADVLAWCAANIA